MPMRWTERQRAMLREMGIQIWAPEATREVEVAVAPAQQVLAEAGATPPVRTAEAAATTRQRTAEAAATTARLPGLAPADWLVVAEPVDEADPQQQHLLDNMLRAIGLALVAPDRERRAVFCAVAPGPASAATRAGDQAALQAALAAVAPRCILAFGSAAAQALLGDDAPLGGLRGRVRTHAGVPVVVTFALAYLLRHPAEKAKAWADLCLAVGSLAASAA
jgi:DNA polymerase